MGALRVTLKVADRPGRSPTSSQALVGSGATYAWAQAAMPRAPGRGPDEHRKLVLIHGRTRIDRIGRVLARLEGLVVPTPALSGGECTESLPGVVTPEMSRLAVDAAGRRLVPGPLESAALDG